MIALFNHPLWYFPLIFWPKGKNNTTYDKSPKYNGDCNAESILTQCMDTECENTTNGYFYNLLILVSSENYK